MSKIVIIGAGAMGSAFALPCIDNKHDVNIVGTHLENNFIDSLKTKENFHPGLNVKLDKKIKIYKFDNIANLWHLYNNHIYLSSGMFFLMKNNILPIYEDKNNINGGYWSIKVSNDDIKQIWLYLSLDLVGGKLDKKNIVSGLSISYKKPVGNGLITCLNKKQAEARGKKGSEAAEAVISVLTQ